MLSKEELSKFDGSPGSPGIYLALLGVVSPSHVNQKKIKAGADKFIFSFFVPKNASISVE